MGVILDKASDLKTLRDEILNIFGGYIIKTFSNDDKLTSVSIITKKGATFIEPWVIDNER